MATPTPVTEAPFLDIESKINTAAMLAYAADKPHENFVWAKEFNKVVFSINLLKSLLGTSLAAVNQLLNGATKVELGEVVDPFATINSSQIPYNLGDTGATYITCTIDGIYYVLAYVGAGADYGNGYSTLSMDNVVILYSSATLPAPKPYEEMCITITQVGTNAPVCEIVPGSDVLAFSAEYISVGKYELTAGSYDDSSISMWSATDVLNETVTQSFRQFGGKMFIECRNNGTLINGQMKFAPVFLRRYLPQPQPVFEP